jgi:hypothetical protein
MAAIATMAATTILLSQQHDRAAADSTENDKAKNQDAEPRNECRADAVWLGCVPCPITAEKQPEHHEDDPYDDPDNHGYLLAGEV